MLISAVGTGQPGVPSRGGLFVRGLRRGQVSRLNSRQLSCLNSRHRHQHSPLTFEFSSGLFRAVGGDTVTVSLYSGHGSGLDGFGQPVRFIWADFQAKPLILDPFWTKFDVFGTYRNFGWDLTSPVLLCTIPAGAFFP